MNCFNVLLMTYKRQTHFSLRRGIILRIFCLPLEAIEFKSYCFKALEANVVDTKGFLRNLVVLMNLFILWIFRNHIGFVDLLFLPVFYTIGSPKMLISL